MVLPETNLWLIQKPVLGHLECPGTKANTETGLPKGTVQTNIDQSHKTKSNQN